MRKRSLAIIFVVGAVLFSAWGNVIAAAFCPRFALNRDCCVRHSSQQAKQAKHESSCHHEMAGMEMDDMQMESPSETSASNSPVESAESSSEQVAFDLPIEACAHCVGHSQPTSGTLSVVAIDSSKRLVETNSLPACFSIDLTRAFADLIVPLEHGPPIPSSPRHVIINVFRI
jgi:hypothetical protein